MAAGVTATEAAGDGVTVIADVGVGVADAETERAGVAVTLGVTLGADVGDAETAGVAAGVGAADALGEVEGAGVSAAYAGSAVITKANAETAVAEFSAKRNARLWGSIRPSSPMTR